jgi:predicted RNase H-like HicB family nuclease
MRRYAVIIERADDGSYGGYVPDLPCCGVCGCGSVDEAKNSLAAAVDMHVAGLVEDGEPVPEPRTEADYVTVDAA